MLEDDDVKLNAINAGPATTDCMAVMGVNADECDGSKNFVSCASCTNKGLGHMVGRVGEPHRAGPVVLRP